MDTHQGAQVNRILLTKKGKQNTQKRRGTIKINQAVTHTHTHTAREMQRKVKTLTKMPSKSL